MNLSGNSSFYSFISEKVLGAGKGGDERDVMRKEREWKLSLRCEPKRTLTAFPAESNSRIGCEKRPLRFRLFSG